MHAFQERMMTSMMSSCALDRFGYNLMLILLMQCSTLTINTFTGIYIGAIENIEKSV